MTMFSCGVDHDIWLAPHNCVICLRVHYYCRLTAMKLRILTTIEYSVTFLIAKFFCITRCFSAWFTLKPLVGPNSYNSYVGNDIKNFVIVRFWLSRLIRLLLKLSIFYIYIVINTLEIRSLTSWEGSIHCLRNTAEITRTNASFRSFVLPDIGGYLWK